LVKDRCKWLIFIGIFFLLLLVGEDKVQARISVSPLMIYKEVSVNNNIISTTVTNLESYPLEITTSLAGLSHNLEGGIEILENEKEIEKAGERFSLVSLDRKFVLAPGEKRKINLKVNILQTQKIKPSGAVYGVLLFSSRPLENTPAEDKEMGVYNTPLPGNKNKTLLNVTRVGVAILVALPGEKTIEGEITQAYLTQTRVGEEINYVLKFKNSGNVHFTPLGGEVIIRNRQGKEAGKFFIQPRICLPERECYLKAKWKVNDLSPGEYIAYGVIEIEKGKEIKVRDIPFTIVKPYILIQPVGKISDLQEKKVVQRMPIDFDFTFTNMGNIDLNPCISLEIREEGNEGKLIREISLQDEKVKVGEEKEYSVITKGLSVGDYGIILRAKYGKPEYGGIRVATAEALLDVIEKELVIKGEITDFNIKVTESVNRIISKVSFKNTGNTEFSVEGLIELKNNQGRTVGQIPVNKTNILEGKERSIEEFWKGSLPVGLYKAELVLIYGEEKTVGKEVFFTVE
jgi:hypothetical protein